MIKSTKKIISIILSIILVTCCCTALIFTVNAATTDKNTSQTTEIAAAQTELNITAKSNLALSVSKNYTSDDKTVNIKLNFQCQERIANGQYEITYDSTKLKLSGSNYDSDGNLSIAAEISKTGGDVVNVNEPGKIVGNYSWPVKPYNFTTEKELFNITFDIIGTGATTVDINMIEMDYIDTQTSKTTMMVLKGKVLDTFNKTSKASLVMSDANIFPTAPETTAPETTAPDTTATNSTTPDTTVPNSEVKLGDVDLDNDINVKDATIIQLHLANFSKLTEKQLLNADVDKDKNVNIKDATLIQLYIAHLIAGFN